MEIPPILENFVGRGKVVLVLGAGASVNSKNASGKDIPGTKELATLLAERFLGGKYSDLPLNQVGEYAISETTLIAVQEFIRETYEPFLPTAAHALLPSFLWWGLATTNYDRLIEKAYSVARVPAQTPVAFIENGDTVDDHIRDPKSVMLLKLHGCITRTANQDCPLILTVDQYIEHRRGRSRLFEHLMEWGYEHPIVFVGQSLQDPDLRAILLELASSRVQRTRHYAVIPDSDEIRARAWEAKRISILNGTFDDFMRTLDSRIPSPFRGITPNEPTFTSLIAETFVQPSTIPSATCQQFLGVDVDYVRAIATTEGVSPKEFYKGTNPGFSAIEQQLDVRRGLADTILSDHFLIEEEEHSGHIEVVLLKAHAGAGKSVLLRRIAWDAAHDYNKACLYLKNEGMVNPAALQELLILSKERIYLFVDDAADRVRELLYLLKNVGQEGKRLTLIVAERINEWNVSCGSLSAHVTESYEVPYLSQKEIAGLLELLRKHQSLGELRFVSEQDRQTAFEEKAGRQLLVALHEATLGKPFEEIIEDEFSAIIPKEAQDIYLTICVLNRLNVPVRAGIVARIHGIPFEEFRERLFLPLEHVVYAVMDHVIRDYTYRARHPHIAQIVFERVLRRERPRFDAYLKCLDALNLDYSADYRAFRQMIRGRVMLELFPTSDLVAAIFDAAEGQVGAEDGYLLQQMAIYEMNRPKGDVRRALGLLEKAAKVRKRDDSIMHSLAEVHLRLVDDSRTPLEQERHLDEARRIATSLVTADSSDSYPFHTLVKTDLRYLEIVAARDPSTVSEEEIEKIVDAIERSLQDGLQRFPDDSYLLESEARLAAILSDSARVIECLRRAFNKNARNAFIAIRLARYFESIGERDEAPQTLKRALDAKQNDKKLHYAYAKLLVDRGDSSTVEYHLKRSYVQGDSNYDAQILYGRQLFIGGDVDGYRDVFKSLADAEVSSEDRRRLRYPISRDFHGVVTRVESTYAFVARDGLGDWIHCYWENIIPEEWKLMARGKRLRFRVGFNFRGPSAVDVDLE